MRFLHIEPKRLLSEPPAAALVVMVVKPTMTLMTRRSWSGMENLPPYGGCIIAANHVSYVDPLLTAQYVYDTGRYPAYLAKDSLFEMPFVGWIMTNAGHIPVHRESSDAEAALADAVEAIREGASVVVYPEGTVTRDPDFWPMKPKNGVARLALATGAPVIPLAQWGAQYMYDHYNRKVALLPPKTITMRAGTPVDISAFEGREWNREMLDDCASVIMQDVKKLLGEIRGQAPPADLAPRPEPRAARAATDAEREAAETAGRDAANRPPRTPGGDRV